MSRTHEAQYHGSRWQFPPRAALRSVQRLWKTLLHFLHLMGWSLTFFAFVSMTLVQFSQENGVGFRIVLLILEMASELAAMWEAARGSTRYLDIHIAEVTPGTTIAEPCIWILSLVW